MVVLEGGPRKRGRAHGEELRPRIKEAVRAWKDRLQRDLDGHPDTYLDEFVENTNFLKAIRKWTPDLLEEVKGIAEGSEMAFKTIYAYQLCDEEWWYRRNRSLGISLSDQARCSALGVFGQAGTPPLLAQNMDIPSWTNGFQTLWRIKHPDTGLEALVFSYAGLIALNGLNNRSVGVCVNALLQLDQRRDGLPVAFVIRGALERPTFAAAVRFVKGVRHASGQNYLIGGRDEIASWECSANKVIRFIPPESGTRICHTNHPLANDSQSIYREVIERSTAEKIKNALRNSETRLRALETYVKDPAVRITVETLKAALRSHDDPQNSVCYDLREEHDGFTAGSSIFELSSPPLMHLAPGPPCATEYRTYGF
jgi:predicted choloylglycine hydrolase